MQCNKLQSTRPEKITTRDKDHRSLVRQSQTGGYGSGGNNNEHERTSDITTPHNQLPLPSHDQQNCLTVLTKAMDMLQVAAESEQGRGIEGAAVTMISTDK
eukprot:2651902-Rhodomonas_salina.4